jgi:NADH dehydrogenase (ubiquinone) 1 alpha subcomplex subunit 5
MALARPQFQNAWLGVRHFTETPTEANKVAHPVKTTTGIAGLAVEPNARQILEELYNETMYELQKFPADLPYRSTVESYTKYRLGIVRSTEDIYTIEQTIDAGQIEELITVARGELKLIDYLFSTKYWNDKPFGIRPEVPIVVRMSKPYLRDIQLPEEQDKE